MAPVGERRRHADFVGRRSQLDVCSAAACAAKYAYIAGPLFTLTISMRR
jgi:hypothetical protein